MKNCAKICSTALTLALTMLFSLPVGVQAVKAQTAPTIRIVVPERFRVLTGQFFDLRVEAEGIFSNKTRLQLIVSNENGSEPLNFSGGLETTNDNDNNPSKLDRAWTYRKVSFATPGIKTVQAIITDGRLIFGVATQISVQDFNLQGQKSIVLFIGDAMGTAY